MATQTRHRRQSGPRRRRGPAWWPVVACALLAVGAMWFWGMQGPRLFEASATVYVGQPLTDTGAQVITIDASSTTATEIVTSDDARERVADEVGVDAEELEGRVSVSAITPSVSNRVVTPPPLIRIAVRSPERDVARDAAVAYGELLVDETSGPASEKIDALERQLASYEAALESLDTQRAAALRRAQSAGSAEQAAIWSAVVASLTGSRQSTESSLADTRHQLSLASQVELGRVLTSQDARRVRHSASTRELALAALLGAIVGAGVVALRRRERPRQQA